MARTPDLERRQELLDRIVDYLAEHGLAQATLRPLAKSLDVSINRLVHHFGSKEQIIDAALRRAEDRQVAVQQAWLQRNPDITMAELYRKWWKWICADPANLALVRLGHEAAALDSTVTGVAGDAEFHLREIVVRGRGGRQLGADGAPSGLAVPDGTVRLYNFHIRPGNIELRGRMTGPLTEAVALLRHPRLKLFEKRPLDLRPAAGQVDGTLTIGFPLWNDLSMDQLLVRGTTKVTGARLLGALAGQDLDRANVDVSVSTEGLKANGQAVFLGAPVRLATEMDFRAGPPAQVMERASLVGRLETPRLAAFGIAPSRTSAGIES